MAEANRLSQDEVRRRRALDGLKVLDTGGERAFDDIVETAALCFQTVGADITLIDGERQWFKARMGFEQAETSRDISFSTHGIRQKEPLVVLNAALDPRFADSPLVAGPPYARFYAGAPLVLPGGAVIGMLCVFDTAPRFRFTDEQIKALKFFAGLAVERLVARAQG
jgi:GAF domain-containing protein